MFTVCNDLRRVPFGHNAKSPFTMRLSDARRRSVCRVPELGHTAKKIFAVSRPRRRTANGLYLVSDGWLMANSLCRRTCSPWGVRHRPCTVNLFTMCSMAFAMCQWHTANLAILVVSSARSQTRHNLNSSPTAAWHLQQSCPAWRSDD